MSLLIQDVKYDDGYYIVTVVNNGEQQVVAGRLNINFVDPQGRVDSKKPNNKYMDGSPVSPTDPLYPNWKFIMNASTIWPTVTYIYITHDICGKISNDYLFG